MSRMYLQHNMPDVFKILSTEVEYRKLDRSQKVAITMSVHCLLIF